MYICICNSVSHHEIEEAVEQGNVSSLSCLRRSLGVGTGCGICLGDAKQCLFDAMARTPLKNSSQKCESPVHICTDNFSHSDNPT
ncbi:MAG: (2Fe-2S)-binding protein [Gammaproteobacteria bacterium]|nr:(2Fe-2S)-binding protein [Gammaproteobacteria bacterium]MCY4219793.1 (2Fe-2S)-binding protein [Gammaproteobacteria bacterium]MCY4275209.1 (2Fe-2S)-binding protein [Gammaproteobacteria bacterium]